MQNVALNCPLFSIITNVNYRNDSRVDNITDNQTVCMLDVHVSLKWMQQIKLDYILISNHRFCLYRAIDVIKDVFFARMSFVFTFTSGFDRGHSWDFTEL